MSSADRLLAILGLFDEERPEWTVEDIASVLDVSTSTAYRYVRSLCGAGLLDPVHGDGYRLGPAIIEYDRLIRVGDPLMSAAQAVTTQLQADAGPHTMAFLSRLYRDKVMCVLDVIGGEFAPRMSYERGRPMSLYRGATSKIILAHLPRRTLRRLYDRHEAEIRAGVQVQDWSFFLTALKELRRRGHCIAEAEIDPGCVGIAAPVFDPGGNVLGSLSVVTPSEATSYATVSRLAALTMAAASSLSERLSASGRGASWSPRIVA